MKRLIIQFIDWQIEEFKNSDPFSKWWLVLCLLLALFLIAVIILAKCFPVELAGLCACEHPKELVSQVEYGGAYVHVCEDCGKVSFKKH